MQHLIELRTRHLAVLRLEGKITVYQLERLKTVLEEISKRIGQRRRLIIDLSNLEFMDALALGVIVTFSKDFREKDGDIKFVNVNGELRQILEESRLSRVYEVYAGFAEAERSFN